jgi:hypothetical protein
MDRRTWIWLGAAAVLALHVAALWIGAFHDRSPNLGLQLFDNDGEVRVEWDRNAAPVVSAERASVLIVDGGRKSETALSVAALRGGSLTYQRRTADVVIRLRVYGPDDGPVQELARLESSPRLGYTPLLQ